jgi:hypothetical protein
VTEGGGAVTVTTGSGDGGDVQAGGEGWPSRLDGGEVTVVHQVEVRDDGDGCDCERGCGAGETDGTGAGVTAAGTGWTAVRARCGGAVLPPWPWFPAPDVAAAGAGTGWCSAMYRNVPAVSATRVMTA